MFIQCSPNSVKEGFHLAFDLTDWSGFFSMAKYQLTYVVVTH